MSWLNVARITHVDIHFAVAVVHLQLDEILGSRHDGIQLAIIDACIRCAAHKTKDLEITKNLAYQAGAPLLSIFRP